MEVQELSEVDVVDGDVVDDFTGKEEVVVVVVVVTVVVLAVVVVLNVVPIVVEVFKLGKPKIS